MNEELRRPLDMLSACLSAGRTFHVLEKGEPWAGFHRLHKSAALNGCCIIRVKQDSKIQGAKSYRIINSLFINGMAFFATQRFTQEVDKCLICLGRDLGMIF
jgi:hypothetical protein